MGQCSIWQGLCPAWLRLCPNCRAMAVGHTATMTLEKTTTYWGGQPSLSLKSVLTVIFRLFYSSGDLRTCWIDCVSFCLKGSSSNDPTGAEQYTGGKCLWQVKEKLLWKSMWQISFLINDSTVQCVLCQQHITKPNSKSRHIKLTITFPGKSKIIICIAFYIVTPFYSKCLCALYHNASLVRGKCCPKSPIPLLLSVCSHSFGC